MKIAFWSDGGSGCEYYRCEMPGRALMDRGHGVVVTNRLDEMPQDIDVIVGQRVALEGATTGWEAIVALGRYKTVYELDDDLLYVDPSNRAAWGFFSDPQIQQNIKRNIQIADAVITTNTTLAERVSLLNSNVHIIPNAIPAWVLDLESPATDDALVTIGWGGGSSHTLDWPEAQSEVARFITRHKNTEMHIMGWQPPELWRRLPHERRRYTDWVNSVPAYYQAIDFSIGLAPLRPHIFNSAKSYIKALEYAALGIPVIASDVGPYADFVEHGVTGYLVRRPHEWAKWLNVLLDEPVRKALGSAARDKAQYHTIEHNIELWEKALCV